MSNQQATRAGIRTLFIAMLVGSVLIALIATFLPPYVDLDPETALIMRLVLYGAAALNVGQAFWLRAKLTRQLPPEERKSGGTIQRQ
jgi:O-antigen/teichoic acid export membrane protein